VDRAGIVGQDGETHQGIYDLSFFNIIPNITIMAPKDFKELEEMLEYALTLNSPVVIRYPRGGEDSNVKFDKCEQMKLGKAEIIKDGNDLTIVAIGKMVAKAVKIAENYEKEGKKVEIINARFLKPFDEETVLNSIKKTKNVITIEDNTIIGGLATKVKELIAQNEVQDVKIKCYAYPDKFIEQGTVDELESKYLFS
jgi:1-deoxy-D-xylulose-5-phosphate synthase